MYRNEQKLFELCSIIIKFPLALLGEKFTSEIRLNPRINHVTCIPSLCNASWRGPNFTEFGVYRVHIMRFQKARKRQLSTTPQKSIPFSRFVQF